MPLIDAARQVARAASKLARRGKATSRGVHRLRGAARRAEACLATLSIAWPKLEPAADRVRRPLARLRRLAGRVRDADVMLTLIDAGLPGLTARDPAHERLRRAIDRRRRETEAELLDRADRLARRITSRLAKLKRLARASLDADLMPPLRAAVQRVERRRQADLAEPEAMHKLRLALKRLRHSADAIGVELPSQGSTIAEMLEQMGHVSDLSMASRFLERLAARASTSRRREWEVLAAACASEARAQAAKLAPLAQQRITRIAGAAQRRGR